jgi:hypothetical protein
MMIDDRRFADRDPFHQRPVRLAVLLGVAGLLPQAAALVAPWLDMGWIDPARLALVYGALILSFLGGSWWGIALTRAGGQQRSILLLLGIGASLLGFCVQGLAAPDRMRALLLLLGGALALSWLVDRMLVRDGLIGAWWGRLRLALSLGLGGLTMLVGVMA